jgi:lipase ATG15
LPSTTPTVTSSVPDHGSTCIRRNWYGRCNDWGDEFKEEI